MKILYDYIPVICFVVAYYLYGIYVATAVAMIASVLQVSLYWLKTRRFEKVHIITLALLLVLGSMTLLFHKEIFIKWKPSILYWIFSLALLLSQFLGSKPILARMLGDKINLPKKAWLRLNLIWSAYFLFLGILNLYVAYHFTTTAWVNFKLFGTLILLFVFVFAQVPYMARHMDNPKKLTDKK